MRKKAAAAIFSTLALVLCGAAHAQQTLTLSDTEQQSNFNGYTQGNDPNHNTAPITTQPFHFTGQAQLASITSVSITLTIFDGDTGLGLNGIDDTPYPPDGTTHGDDDDFINTLHLRLDGIDTANVPGSASPPASLLLNGFNSYDPNTPIPQGFITRTITGMPDNAAAILAALQDGTLIAQIFDAGFTDRSNSSQNGFVVPSTQYQSATPIFATLAITGTTVPEPGTLTWIGAAAMGALGVMARQRRKRK